MPKIIPFDESSSYIQQTPLDGTTYIIKIVWNSRGGFWTISFYDLDNNPILLGIRIVQGVELLSQYRSYAIPSGELYAMDLSRDFSDIERDDFTGDRNLRLIYFAESEL